MERLRKGDQVVVIAGKDKGKKGEIIQSLSSSDKLLVKGLNLVKKSVKKSKEKPNGGFVEVEAPIHASNAMLVCPKCGKGVRVGVKIGKNGEKVRICKKCDHKFEESRGS